MTELARESMETTLGQNSRLRIAKRIRWKYRILKGVNVNFFQGCELPAEINNITFAHIIERKDAENERFWEIVYNSVLATVSVVFDTDWTGWTDFTDF